MTPSRSIAAAIELFNARRFEQALALVSDRLEGNQADVDALNLAAACQQALGRADAAERLWRMALERDPAHVASWNNLGILLQQQGQGDAAQQAYQRALALQPGYVDAHYNLGLLFQQAGAFEPAIRSLERVLALRPTHAGASASLGVILERLGQLDEAQRCFGAAVEADPADVLSLQRRSDLLQRLGRHGEALDCYRAALALRPDGADLLNNAAVLHARLGQGAAAEQGYRRALALQPGYADAWHNLGLLYTQHGQAARAEAALRTCIELRPQDAEAWISLGNLYQHQLRDQDAEDAYARALVARPGHAKALNNLGALYQRQGQVARAEKAYREAIDADPGYPEARWNLGFLLLAQGRLAEGWPWMEARHDPALARPIAVRPRLDYPQWQGESLAGRTIVVWPEQGFGDQIQFVRYLPMLKAAGAREVILVCHDPLLPLLRTAAGADRIVGFSEAARLPPQDFWVFMLSLPMRFGTTLATIPASLPYLTADAQRVARWLPRLEPTRGKMRVGLVWRGFRGHVNDVHRSLPGLDCLAPLRAVPGVSFVSLQRGMDGEAPTTMLAPEILDLGADIADFGDTAAIVAQLDLVICVDTAVAHVAGALGKPCWVLLPAVHPDWRWMENRSDAPWYPTVLKLYRQRVSGSWDAVIASVAKDLADLPASPHPCW